ncbi:hypothetical protein, partial [Serratia marcescens]|uniref:hypothetical protein n=1 Tax=Serratia marcescens TaxID=615 RepID=UPI001CA37BDA
RGRQGDPLREGKPVLSLFANPCLMTAHAQAGVICYFLHTFPARHSVDSLATQITILFVCI